MMWSYLSTYRIFTPTQELLRMWMTMYTAERRATVDGRVAQDFNHRMVLFMLYWIKHFFDQDFKDKPAFYELVDFINKHVPRKAASTLQLAFLKDPSTSVDSHSDGTQVEGSAANAIGPMLRSLAHGGHSRKSSIGSIRGVSPTAKPRATASPFIPRSPPTRSPGPHPRKSSRVYIEDLSPSEIAVNLTAIEFSFFEKVRADELFHMNWQKPDRETLAPNISSLTQRFNQVSYWVATEVVTAPTPKQRVNILKKFIKSAEKLRALNNFNSVMEVVAGLNNSSVLRLKGLWNTLPSQYVARFDELDRLTSPAQNFRLYREEVRHVECPAIPYFAPMLRDVTFIYDGNREFISPGRINFEIMELLGNQVYELSRYQRVGYTLPTADPRVLGYLKSVRPMDEDLLRKFSFKAEPAVKEIRLREGGGALNSPFSKSDSDFSLFSSSEFFIPISPREDPFSRRTERVGSDRLDFSSSSSSSSSTTTTAASTPAGGGDPFSSSRYLTPETAGGSLSRSPHNRHLSLGLAREVDTPVAARRKRSRSAVESVVAGGSSSSSSSSSSSKGEVEGGDRVTGKAEARRLPLGHDRVVANVYKLPRPRIPPKSVPTSPRMPVVMVIEIGHPKASNRKSRRWLRRWGGSLEMAAAERQMFRRSAETDEDDNDNTGEDYTEEDDSSSKPGESDSYDDDEDEDEDDDDEVGHDQDGEDGEGAEDGTEFDESSYTEGLLSTADFSDLGSEASARSDGGDGEATEEGYDDDEGEAEEEEEEDTATDFSLADDDDMSESCSEGSGIDGFRPTSATSAAAGQAATESKEKRRKGRKETSDTSAKVKKTKRTKRLSLTEEQQPSCKTVASSVSTLATPKGAQARRRSSLRLSTTIIREPSGSDLGSGQTEPTSLGTGRRASISSAPSAASSSSGPRPRWPESGGTGVVGGGPRDEGVTPTNSSEVVVTALHSYYDAIRAKIDVRPRRGGKKDGARSTNNRGRGRQESNENPHNVDINAAGPNSGMDRSGDGGLLKGQPAVVSPPRRPVQSSDPTMITQLHTELKEKGLEQKEQKAKMRVIKESLHKEMETRKKEREKKQRTREIRDRMLSELRERAKPTAVPVEGEPDSSNPTSVKEKESPLPRWRRPFFTSGSRSISVSSLQSLLSSSSSSSSSTPTPPALLPALASDRSTVGGRKGGGNPVAAFFRGGGDAHDISGRGGGEDRATATNNGGSAIGGSLRVKAHARKRSLGQGSLFLRELLHREIRSADRGEEFPSSSSVVLPNDRPDGQEGAAEDGVS